MELNELRGKIDAIDREITRLFDERMQIAAEIAAYKRENNLPVLDAAREREKLCAIAESVRPEMREYTLNLYSAIFAQSRGYQEALNRAQEEVN